MVAACKTGVGHRYRGAGCAAYRRCLVGVAVEHHRGCEGCGRQGRAADVGGGECDVYRAVAAVKHGVCCGECGEPAVNLLDLYVAQI